MENIHIFCLIIWKKAIIFMHLCTDNCTPIHTNDDIDDINDFS